VVRALSYELAAKAPATMRLIVFDANAGRYFALASPDLIRAADSLADIGAEARVPFDLDTLAAGDIFFEPDATWSEPVNRGALFRRLKAKGVIVVVLNHDVIPFLLPQFFPPNTLVSFSETIADHLQYADYALATSPGVDRDLRKLAERFLGRSMTTRVIKLGADLAEPGPADADEAFAAAFPALAGLRFLLTVGTVEPRKNHALLLRAFDRLEAKDAGLVIVGRKGWMADDVLAAVTGHPEFGKRLFWYETLDDQALALYRHAYASVLPSQYEGYGLPVVEALCQGCATIISDAGSLPHVAAGAAEIFPRQDGEALFGILDRLYRDPGYHAELRKRAASFRPTSWREAGESVALALDDIAAGVSHDFAAPVRQMVYLSIHPEILDLSLTSARANLRFIDRVVILTSPQAKGAIAAVAKRHFGESVVLSDDEVLDGSAAAAEHTPRNTWLRRLLYRHEAIEPNFIAADEDYLALAPVGVDHFQNRDVHSGYYFLEDMGTWLAGSPTTTSFDRGMRNTWRLLREAAYPVRGFASHRPQIINKSLVNEIYGRFIMDADRAWHDEWSLYFNVARQRYPRHVRAVPTGTLGWPMRPGDWLPEILPTNPAFENYYPANYAPDGMFARLSPRGDREAKIDRALAAIARARHAEVEGGGAHTPGMLGVVVTPEALKFVGTGTMLAGKGNVRRVLLLNGGTDAGPVKGKLEMFVTDARGALVRGETVRLGEVCWIPLLPPEAPGLYPSASSPHWTGVRASRRAVC